MSTYNMISWRTEKKYQLLMQKLPYLDLQLLLLNTRIMGPFTFTVAIFHWLTHLMGPPLIHRLPPFSNHKIALNIWIK